MNDDELMNEHPDGDGWTGPDGVWHGEGEVLRSILGAFAKALAGMAARDPSLLGRFMDDGCCLKLDVYGVEELVAEPGGDVTVPAEWDEGTP